MKEIYNLPEILRTLRERREWTRLLTAGPEQLITVMHNLAFF